MLVAPTTPRPAPAPGSVIGHIGVLGNPSSIDLFATGATVGSTSGFETRAAARAAIAELTAGSAPAAALVLAGDRYFGVSIAQKLHSSTPGASIARFAFEHLSPSGQEVLDANLHLDQGHGDQGGWRALTLVDGAVELTGRQLP